jgi:hypothetical protein
MKLRPRHFLPAFLIAGIFLYHPEKERIPKLGIVAPIEQDSLIYASGFRMLGESVGKMLSPAIPE